MINKAITIHPEGHTNVCTKFHSDPSNSSWEMSLKATNVNLVAVLQEKSDISKASRIRHLGTMDVRRKIHGISFNSCRDISVSGVSGERTANRLT